MALGISFTEVYDERLGEVAEAGNRTVVRSWAVTTEDASIGPADVLAHPDCPQWGDLYAAPGQDDPPEVIPVDQALTITRLSVRPVPDSPRHFRLTATYSSRAGVTGLEGGAAVGVGPGVSAPGGESGAIGEPASGAPEAGDVSGGGEAVAGNTTYIENPILRPAVLRYGTITRQVIAEWDKDALNPIRNSAGVPFDPPIQIEEAHLTFTITRNQASFNRTDIADYVKAINSTSFLGFAARTVRLNDLSAERLNENGVFFWQVTYVFEVNTDGWNPVKILDAGYEENFAGDLQKVLDRCGNPVTRPSLLDGNGLVLSDPQNDPPVFLSYNLYREVDFNDFRFW